VPDDHEAESNSKLCSLLYNIKILKQILPKEKIIQLLHTKLDEYQMKDLPITILK
jgi:hypothetical protein